MNEPYTGKQITIAENIFCVDQYFSNCRSSGFTKQKKKIISQYKVPPWPKGFLKIKNAQANKHS